MAAAVAPATRPRASATTTERQRAERRTLARRRRLFAALVALTSLALAAWTARLLAADGSGPLDLVLLLLFAATLPWLAIGLWSSAIGLAILLLARDPAAHVTPALARTDPAAPLRSRTAVVVPVFEEDPSAVFRHLAATLGDLEARPEAAAFELFLLSDTRDPAIAAEEERRFADLRARSPAPDRLHYRRRADNRGHKAGNYWEFLEARGSHFDLMLLLDADSLMSGEAIVRLARVMDQNPEIGILQQLIVGLPTGSPFARLFQVGMRHGMRTYTHGAAWWQGDCGPFWGHNGIVRVAPFVRHCRLPVLPGSPPFGGRVLSHDQVEAVLMRRAGHEVRVLPLEDGSYELNPPTAVEFIVRDRRWAQGNLQYFGLLGRRLDGAHLTGRAQLLLAVLMYLNPPLYLAFAALALGRATLQGLDLVGPEGVWLAPGALGVASPAEPWLLLATLLGVGFAPRLIGAAQILVARREARAYGGRAAVLATVAAELAFSLVLLVVAQFAQAVHVAATLAGRAVGWGAQARAARTLGWREALAFFRPHTMAGLAVLLLAAPLAGDLAPWALLLGGGLLLAAPFAVLTARLDLGAWLARHRLAATPEELAPPPVVAAAGPPAV